MAKTKKSTAPANVDARRAKDRRDRPERRKQDAPATPAATERRLVVERRVKVSRRRQIDPTTCQRDYSTDEIEFMNALDAYKRTSGRMFPTCSEVLEVLRDLGYEKRNATSKTAADSFSPIDSDAETPSTSA